MNKEILKQMQLCKLNNHNWKKILPTLLKLNNKSEQEIKNDFGELIQNGYIIKDEKNNYHTIESLDLYRGKIIGNSNGYAFCDVEDQEKDVYISIRNLHGAMHNDEVLISISKSYGDKYDGVVNTIIKRGLTHVVGKITVFKKFAFVEPDNRKIYKDVHISLKDINNAKSGDKVYVKITKFGAKNLDGIVEEVLGKENTILSDVLSIVRNYDLIEEFPEEVNEESKKISNTVSAKQIKNRVDLRKEIIFTIDGDDSKDFDDAVSITFDKDVYKLGVHIADVGEYVKRGSVIDEEAFKRATSVYFPNYVLPMLPHELSDDICSLVPNKDRLTLSCVMEINKNGIVQNYQIFESVINSTERMTYNNVTKLLTTEDVDLHKRYEKIMPSLLLMQELCLILENVRNKRGSLDFEIPEPKILIDENQEVVELLKRPRTISERIIESFMIIANETIAKNYCKKEFSFVYRIHEAPEALAIKKFEEFIKPLGLSIKSKTDKISSKDIQQFLVSLDSSPYKDVVNKVLLRSKQKAKYRPECLGHFGLGAEYYCHFTSPIRRYPDLTIHRFIKDDLRGSTSKEHLLDMENFALLSSLQSSEKEISADKAERDVDAYYKARYMRKHIGEVFEGLISGVINFGLYVELPNTAEGFVPIESLPGDRYVLNEKLFTLSNNEHKFQLGDKITVKVESANLNERKVTFSLVNKKND